MSGSSSAYENVIEVGRIQLGITSWVLAGLAVLVVLSGFTTLTNRYQRPDEPAPETYFLTASLLLISAWLSAFLAKQANAVGRTFTAAAAIGTLAWFAGLA